MAAFCPILLLSSAHLKHQLFICGFGGGAGLVGVFTLAVVSTGLKKELPSWLGLTDTHYYM